MDNQRVTDARSAVILARGAGTRMRRMDSSAALDPSQETAAAGGMKAMMPVAGRPFLDYGLSVLADAGFARAVLVIGPEQHDVREHYRAHPPERIELSYAMQAEPRGTADAVLAAEPTIERDAFVVLNGDNYYPREPLETLRTSAGPCVVLYDRAALVERGTIPPDRIAAYALATIDGDGNLASVEEKPAAASDDRRAVSMNAWRFDARIFDACRRIPPSPRGELELPRAVEYAIRHLGLKMRASIVRQPVLDLSRRADVAVVADRLRGVEPRP